MGDGRGRRNATEPIPDLGDGPGAAASDPTTPTREARPETALGRGDGSRSKTDDQLKLSGIGRPRPSPTAALTTKNSPPRRLVWWVERNHLRRSPGGLSVPDAPAAGEDHRALGGSDGLHRPPRYDIGLQISTFLSGATVT
ncbi:hypothetical protein Acsp01_38120 [Actinoplanes sp. NBRC 101535]|nr:hypothetical protein Acsp01_38120 [Actinoplanes sp. NBRC 101535]